MMFVRCRGLLRNRGLPLETGSPQSGRAALENNGGV